jgi:predicted RNA-binding protein with EMAP domain
MKKLLTILLFTASIFIYGQEEKMSVNILKDIEPKITSIKYSANSTKELENIDWKELKDLFDTNTPEEKIALSFAVDLKESKHNFKSSVTISGETKNIDSLITNAKKGVTAIIKISKKYQNK